MREPVTLGRERLWTRLRLKERWTYIKAVFRKFRGRLLSIVLVLVTGAFLFQRHCDPETPLTFFQGLYYTWCLIFFEPQMELPKSWVLDVLFFLVPILGLMILIETFVEISMTLRDWRRNEREWCVMLASQMKNHVVLVGFGRLGFRTFGHLRQMRVPVVIIESNEKNEFLDNARAHHAPILIGDGRNDQLLIDANVEGAASVICCTNNDLANLEIALDARRMNPGIRVVMRMFDQNLADKIREGFDIHVAISTTAMAAPSFAAAASDATIRNSFTIDGRLIVTTYFRVTPESELAERTMEQIGHMLPMTILAHHPAAEPRANLFPKPQDVVRVRDRITAQLYFEDLKKLHELNHSTSPAVGA